MYHPGRCIKTSVIFVIIGFGNGFGNLCQNTNISISDNVFEFEYFVFFMNHKFVLVSMYQASDIKGLPN